MDPSVSVVIPAYNHAAFIGETIQSVLDQSYADLEIVITDDGSSDGTPDVVRRFTDPRIDLEVFDKNQGAAIALNSAIRRTRGEFVCMLASDDYFLPGKLDKQVQFLRANAHIAAVFGMPRFIDERGAPLAANFNGDIFTTPFAKKLRSRQDWLRHFFFEGNCLLYPSTMIRRSIYDEIGLLDPRLANLPDFDVWVRLCMAHEIHVMPDKLTAMRILDNNRNMSAPRRDTNLRTLVEYFQILKHYRRLSREAIKDVFAREIAETHLDAEGPLGPLLAEIALLGQHPAHKLFALDTMFQETPASGGNYPRLIDLAGSVDVFAIETVRNERRLRAEAAQLRSAVSAAAAKIAGVQAEATRLTSALEAEQRLAARLHTALDATYAKSTRLDDELVAANANIARMTSALRFIEVRIEDIRIRSRGYKLARQFKGLRQAIDGIADEVARALSYRDRIAAFKANDRVERPWAAPNAKE
jgi:glycosyltransferase involved in cell wall biosynthesis